VPPRHARVCAWLAAASLDGPNDHPAISEHKTTAGPWRQSTYLREQMADQPVWCRARDGGALSIASAILKDGAPV
jgi:hypothetical protein